MIHPSDVAFAILLLKNSKALWESEFDKNEDSAVAVRTLFNSQAQKKHEFGKVMWSNEGMEFFNMCKSNWDKVYADKEHWDTLQSDWCSHIKHMKTPLQHMQLNQGDKKQATVEMIPTPKTSELPLQTNKFFFPGNEEYEGDEYEIMRRRDAMQMPALQDLNQDEINHGLILISDATGQENDEEEEDMVSEKVAETVARVQTTTRRKRERYW